MKTVPRPTDSWTEIRGVRLHHLDWEGSGPDIVCLHGLTGNAHSFDGLARNLAPGYRVLALDVRGRGESAWAPADTYVLPEYVADVERWLEVVGLGRTTIIGTSMGGLIAIALAARRPERVTHVVLNDVGPSLEREGLERIRRYVGNAPEVLPDLDAVVRFFRSSYPGQRLTDTQVREWAGFATRPLAQGGLGWRYDPAIRKQMSIVAPGTDAPDLWVPFEALRCPVLVVRGGASDLLSREALQEMHHRGADCRSVEVAGVGHAPALVEPEALDAIREFLPPLRTSDPR